MKGLKEELKHTRVKGENIALRYPNGNPTVVYLN